MFFYVHAIADHRPIGIFDSGIGGMTVAHAVNELMPNESIVYFGDTAHLPYGDKSKDLIKQYTGRIAEWLIAKDCKAVIVACNTASAYGFDAVEEACNQASISCFNVVDPVVEHVAEFLPDSKIGVIGTKGTISSRVYLNRLKKLAPEIKAVSAATPLLAPMIEEGYFANNISQTIIDSYLSKPTFKGIEVIVLGCTHYPLIKSEVDKYYKGKVKIIDSAEVVARSVARKLTESKLTSTAKTPCKLRFFVSDFTTSFAKSSIIFFGERVDLTEVRLWDQL